VAHVGVTPAFWRGRRVFLTGHTGFKGSWLALWLQRLGAEVTGYSIDVPTTPSFYEAAGVEADLTSLRGDVRNLEALTGAISDARPEIVVHMAAQSLVRTSYDEPVETFSTNVIGTVNVLEAVRSLSGVRVVLNVTSDKCYLNRGWEWGYREIERLGGDDPYSASKACAELVTTAYQHSFFAAGAPAIASARSGNVIGGGDWAPDRLVPDVMRAALAGSTVTVRNPYHVRPWQHVLNPLSGYLKLLEGLWDDPALGEAWNFGPPESDARSVSWVVAQLAELWSERIDIRMEDNAESGAFEARVLKLDSTRARERLVWRPSWTLEQALDATVGWYRAFRSGDDTRQLALAQIAAFEAEGAEVA
jgi:CDP-glucose 4,6-dehydratase